jgi:4-aminobutyrate aminotransferase-like enzyme
MEREDVPARAERAGARLAERLGALDGVADVRGLGLLLGVELDPAVLDGRTAKDIADACLRAGLVLNGITATALRLAPAITISDADLDEGIAILATVLDGDGDGHADDGGGTRSSSS